MHEKFLKSFERLERRKTTFLKRLENVDDDHLHYRLSHDDWSLAQVIGHINDSELASLLYCKKKILAGNQLPKSSVFSFARLIILIALLKSKIRVKAPIMLKQPSNVLVFHDLCMTWFNTRKSLKDFIESVPDHLANRAIYKHPFMGRFTLNEMLLFFDAHMKHHEHQIDRILKKIDRLDTNK